MEGSYYPALFAGILTQCFKSGTLLLESLKLMQQ